MLPLVPILGGLMEIGSKLIDKLIPDPVKKLEMQFELLKLQQNGEFKEIDTALEYARQQTAINLEQAKSDSFFLAGPRPGLMWVGVAGVAYQWIVVPIGTFAYQLYTGHQLPFMPPVMDSNLMIMLGGLMGVHIVGRSAEKIKGASSG
jgi:hypothetical protein